MRVFLALLCMAACTATFSAEVPPLCRHTVVPVDKQQPVADFSGTLPIPDYLDGIIACNTRPPGSWLATPAPAPIPPSLWVEAQRDLYQGVLSGHQVDLLILPFQTQGYGLDRIERSLMAADLAYAIGSTGKYSVADPWLVERALGDGVRRIDPAAAQRLANKIGAHKVLYTYVGHDEHHNFTLTLQLRDLRDPHDSGWQRDWRNVAFTDEETPAVKFHDMLPEVLKSLPLGVRFSPPKARSAKLPAAVRIQVALSDLPTSPGSPAPAFATLDLLGALSEPQSEVPRERLFERALLSAWNTSGDDPQKRFFEAYALFVLGRRPTALQLLGNRKGPQEATLRAVVDGDLPSAQQSLAQVPDSLERLLLQISVRDLEAFYQRKQKTTAEPSANTFGPALATWQPLVLLRVNASDRWNVSPPLAIKSLLDWVFPQAGLNAAALAQGAAGRGEEVDDIDVDLANVRHLRGAASHLEPAVCCTSSSLQPSRWDLLWMLEGLTEARIVKYLGRMESLQGLPEETLAALTRYEPLMGGHPSLEAARCVAAAEVAEKSPDDSRASWQAKSQQSAAVAAYWDPGLNQTSQTGLLCMGIPSPASSFMADAYDQDYPPHPGLGGWLFYGHEERASGILERLPFSSWDISLLNELQVGSQPGQADPVLASLGNRFNGNPGLPHASGPMTPAHLDPQRNIARLRQAIKTDPDLWQNYWWLGSTILESGGSFTEASEVFMSYPGFHDSDPDDAVALSNDAFDAGAALYADGMLELSKPFYKISADLDTGSEAGMISKIRLETMAGDFPHAAVDLLERATRYSGATAYRDYLSYLHAFGHGKEAWSAFLQLDASFEVPAVWVSALVGHRMQGTEEAAIRKWLREPQIRDARFKGSHFAPYYAVLWNAVDRMPPADLGKLVEELDGPPAGHIGDNGTVLVPHPEDPHMWMGVYPSAFRAGKKPRLPNNTPVKSELAYFADAYAAVRAGSYATALTRFDAMGDLYRLEGYPLPYFAYAAAKTGDPEHLETYLDTLKGNPTYYYWLARAVFAGAHSDLQGAQQALVMALRTRQSTTDQPIPTEYNYAEVCDWLYQETRDARFANDLLEWVKAMQLTHPTNAWAYTMQYSYEKPGAARVRALAIARYLDPKSPRIQGASEGEIRDAAAWLKANNPFRIEAAPQRSAASEPTTSRRTWR